MKITIIGCGNMGGIFAIRAAEFFETDQIFACDHNEDKLSKLPEKITKTGQVSEAVSEADLIFLAVKPQSFADTAVEIKGAVKSDATVVSVMAGVKIEAIKKELGVDSVIRAMPNTPISVGFGVVAWVANAEIENGIKTRVSDFFATLGLSLPLTSEEELDRAAILFGCGPAYFYYLTETLAEAAVSLGLGEETAKQLSIKTAVGACALMEDSDDVVALRKAVTSKGGITFAAITHLEEAGFRELWKEAFAAAMKRTDELSRT